MSFEGTYFVQCQMVHVQWPLGSKATRLVKSSPEAMAKLLLLSRPVAYQELNPADSTHVRLILRKEPAELSAA